MAGSTTVGGNGPTRQPLSAEADGPTDVIWDITYACPLRCSHCYSESGRRPSEQLGRDALLEVTDRIICLSPKTVALAGGEPLLVRDIFEVAGRMAGSGISVLLYTSGWSLSPLLVDDVCRVFAEVHVSVDAATADVHDGIRGRVGSFQRAMESLGLLDAAARERRHQGGEVGPFGIDYVVVRSNFGQMEQLCTDVALRFPELGFIAFCAAVPAGLASRAGFADHELLSDEQVRVLTSGDQVRRLQSLLPSSVRVTTTDNWELQMNPDIVAGSMARRTMQVEPDGSVRAMPIYEGTVGNLLTESPQLLWRRAVSRWSDPYVTDTLSSVRTMSEWAEATRRIDYHFGSNEVRARIDRRPAYPGRPIPPASDLRPSSSTDIGVPNERAGARHPAVP